MDKLQQYYESLPLCTGNTPGNVMLSVYNDIDNLDSLTRWFDLPDDEAYNKVPNLTFQRTGLPDAFAGYPCIAVLFFENRAGDDPFFREHRATFRQMYLDGYAQGEAEGRQFLDRMAAYGTQSIADRRAGLLKMFGKCRAKYRNTAIFDASLLLKMGHYAGYMFTIADALVAMALLIKPGNKAGRKKASISEIIAGDSAAVISRVRAAINAASGDKAQAVVDEIRQMQRDGLIIDGSLDKKVKSLYDFLKAAINNMPAYSNVIDRFLLKDQKG